MSSSHLLHPHAPDESSFRQEDATLFSHARLFSRANDARGLVSGTVGAKVAGNPLVQIQKELGKPVLRGERTGGDVALDAYYALGQERRELAVAREAEGSLETTGGAAWRCSFWSHEISTGSRSKAMDKATCRGMRSQRVRSRASAVSFRQR
jgi:hypothetical protein